MAVGLNLFFCSVQKAPLFKYSDARSAGANCSNNKRIYTSTNAIHQKCGKNK